MKAHKKHVITQKCNYATFRVIIQGTCFSKEFKIMLGRNVNILCNYFNNNA